MNGIAVNVIVLILKGIPEGMLIVLALHVFTRTEIDMKKYLLLSLVEISATYLFRRLPIMLGVHTVLTLLVLILVFQFTYKSQLSNVIKSIIASAVIFILVAISEVLNMQFLISIFGQTKAEELFTSEDGITQSIYTFPSSVFLAGLIFVGYLVSRLIDMWKNKNAKAG